MTTQSRAEQLEEKRRFWKKQIAHWKGSGLTQTEFCHLHNLKANQFTYWKKRFDRSQASVSLVELQWNPALQPAIGAGPTPCKNSIRPDLVSISA